MYFPERIPARYDITIVQRVPLQFQTNERRG
jgi:hypothetical protein